MLTVIGNAGFSDVDNTTLLEHINDAYHDILSLEPWPFLEKQVTLTFDGTSGVPTNAPSDLRSLITLNDLATGIKQDPIRVEEHRRLHGANLTLQGNPIYYFWAPAYTLNVYPIPEADQEVNQLQLLYVAWDSDLTSASLSADLLLPARFHRVIIDGVLSKLYLEENDQGSSDYFQDRQDRGVTRMRTSVWQRNFDRPDTIESTNDDMDFYGGQDGADFGSFAA